MKARRQLGFRSNPGTGGGTVDRDGAGCGMHGGATARGVLARRRGPHARRTQGRIRRSWGPPPDRLAMARRPASDPRPRRRIFDDERTGARNIFLLGAIRIGVVLSNVGLFLFCESTGRGARGLWDVARVSSPVKDGPGSMGGRPDGDQGRLRARLINWQRSSRFVSIANTVYYRWAS